MRGRGTCGLTEDADGDPGGAEWAAREGAWGLGGDALEAAARGHVGDLGGKLCGVCGCERCGRSSRGTVPDAPHQLHQYCVQTITSFFSCHHCIPIMNLY